MEFNDKIKLVILCGALRDVAEKCKEEITQRQIEDIRIKIEEIVTRDSVMHNALANAMNGVPIEHQELNDIVDDEFENENYKLKR